MKYIVVVYDDESSTLERCDVFDDHGTARAVFLELEETWRSVGGSGTAPRPLLFAAPDVTALKRTHPHYFAEPSAPGTLPRIPVFD